MDTAIEQYYLLSKIDSDLFLYAFRTNSGHGPLDHKYGYSMDFAEVFSLEEAQENRETFDLVVDKKSIDEFGVLHETGECVFEKDNRNSATIERFRLNKDNIIQNEQNVKEIQQGCGNYTQQQLHGCNSKPS